MVVSEQQKMGYIYLLFTTHTKNYKPIQEHKHQNRLQMQQHIRTAHQTCLKPQHPAPQQKWDLQLDM